MKLSKTNRLSSKLSKQQGAVLVVSLVVLALLTVIGITSSNQSIMQSLMTSNSQFQSEAAISAEQTLLAAERDIEAMVADTEIKDFEGDKKDQHF